MANPTKKKWSVKTGTGDEVTVEAERMSLNEGSARITFYVGDEPVASFVGYSNVYPVV